jgi:hypothetical protein
MNVVLKSLLSELQQYLTFRDFQRCSTRSFVFLCAQSDAGQRWRDRKTEAWYQWHMVQIKFR